MTTAQKIEKQLQALGDAVTAAQSMRFFKTGPGQYGEGDLFLGIRVPVLRRMAKELINTPLDETIQLLQSPFHEARMLALLIWVYQAKRGDKTLPLYRAYLANTARINNWDLVDVSAEHIIGRHLFERYYAPPYPVESKRNVEHASRIRERVSAQKHRLPRIPGKPVLQYSSALPPLTRLAKSDSLWERRIAILSTFHFIRRNDFADTLAIAELLLNDKEDLMHKAVGWMLREVGKRNREVEEAFLLPRCQQMPRTMLRYAIERFPEPLRLAYLRGKK
jgi:3-methyladenine DNA glycosylase AlkD